MPVRNLYYKASVWVSTLLLLFLPVTASAQLSKSVKNLTTVKSELTGSPTNLPEFIGSLINVFLSVLGLIFLILVVYAGYLWMTDAGAGDKVKKAKSLLGTAIIGLIIVVAAYAISAFVIDRIVANSGENTPVPAAADPG